MKTKELRECNDERLEELEKTLRRQIFEARIKNFTNQLDDTASIARARRELARVKTLRTERVLAAVPAESEGA
ncbi:MAG: 50S ribosomal protein L29 [Myxococcales bacterium]|nr:50S ribosomal protein L29 [Myxococcales bacterium]